MKQQYVFKGQMPILFTTYHADGSIDTDSQKRLIDLLVQNKPAALGHLGGASDYQKLSQKERDLCITTLVERVNGRYPVFIGNTDLSLQQSLANAKRAQELGANLLMTCSPIYGHATQDQLFDYYKALCDTVSLPIIVQDTGASANEYTPAFMMRLSELPNIGYAKCEGPKFLTYTSQLLKMAGERLQVIGGAGGNGMIQLLDLGITAFMTGTEAPEIHNAVIHAYLEGQAEKAEEIYNSCIAPYLFLYGLKPKQTSQAYLHARGIIQTPSLPWPNEEGEPDAVFIDAFLQTMTRCKLRLDGYMG